MDLDGDLAERIRAVLAGTGIVRKVRMVGGLCFMVNGNMVAGTSKHGLLVRVGKDQHSRALARGQTQSPWNCRGGRWRAMSSSIRPRVTSERYETGSSSVLLS